MADQNGLIMAWQRDGETVLVAVNMNAEARVFELGFPLDTGNFRALVGRTARNSGRTTAPGAAGADHRDSRAGLAVT
jgi:hypothetical protein